MKLEPMDFPVVPSDSWAMLPVEEVFKRANKYYQSLAARVETPHRTIDVDYLDEWNNLDNDGKAEVCTESGGANLPFTHNNDAPSPAVDVDE